MVLGSQSLQAHAHADAGSTAPALFIEAPVVALAADSLPQDSLILQYPDQHAGALASLPAGDPTAILDRLDSLVAQLDRTAFRPAVPVVQPDSLGWGVRPEGWPKFDDAILVERLQAIPTTIPLDFNRRVRSWIEMYTLRGRDGVQRMLGLTPLYFPMIEEELDRRNLPMELKHVPIIESALNPRAVSRQGATGLWQIMYRTGRSLDLRIDTYVDERRDPQRATEAGLDYLEDLYRIYGDWLVVIAAYNCGPGNVNKAMRRSGGKRGIWEIFPYLPRETRGYVPAFIAATYTFNYPEEHGFKAWQPVVGYGAVDTIAFPANASFSALAPELGMSVEELRFYNPALKRDYVPGGSKAYPLRLPLDRSTALAGRMDSVLAAVSTSPSAAVVTVAERTAPDPQYFDRKGYTRLVYTVKSGDNLGFIAEWYGVGVSDLRNWNNIYGSRIRIGQKVAVYKKDAEASAYADIDKLDFAAKQARAGKSTGSGASGTVRKDTPSPVGEAPSGSWRWYTVKSGDSLWSIAQNNPGNSIEGIARLNNISTRTTLKLGQRLKVLR
jgi:membrane-bound lytic murein transglycosylase D